MARLSLILVALDSSKASQRAFDEALALSRSSGAELIAIHAVPRQQAFGHGGRARLDWTSRLRLRAEEAGVAFRVRTQHGDPADVVLLHARTLQPDTIVVGTHQRLGLDRLRRGSVAERIASRANVPVLLVPPHGAAPAIRPFRHVAVAVDFGAASSAAIERALAAAAPGDRVTLLHVIPGFSGGVPPHYYRRGLAEHQADLVQDARRRLEQAVPMERQPASGIDTMVLVGDTTTEISSVLPRIGADMLVVGVSKRGAVSRALFGTTASRLLRTLRVPMLAVPEAVAAATDRRVSTAQKRAA